MIVKVCGVRTGEIAEAAIDAGADWIGLMLVPKSQHAGDLKVFVEDVFVSADGSRVVGRYRYEGPHTGNFLGYPATGNGIAMRRSTSGGSRMDAS